MAEKQNIPGSSNAELKKIIAGYASSKEAMSLTEVSKKTGMDSTVISRNTKFLGDMDFITTGAKKQATEHGRKYARALEHKQDEAARALSTESIKQSEFLSDLVTTVRIKEGMQLAEFTKHVLFVANQADNSGNRTGANTIADFLVESGLLTNADGLLKVATVPDSDGDDDTDENDPPAEQEDDKQKQQIKEKIVYKEAPGGNHPQVTINITLQIPEVDDPDVYDRFFKAMKTNLFPDG